MWGRPPNIAMVSLGVLAPFAGFALRATREHSGWSDIGETRGVRAQEDWGDLDCEDFVTKVAARAELGAGPSDLQPPGRRLRPWCKLFGR